MAIKRSFILSSGIGVSADNLFVVNNTNSVSSTTGSIVLSGGIGIGQSASISGRLQLFNGANYTAFVSSASGNTVYTLPSTSPATGSSVLQSDSAGVMSWVPMTATGGASGNTAQNIVVNSAGNASAFHPILFTPASLSAGSAVSSDGTISFNPSTEILNVSGLAITNSTASTSTSNGALQVAGGVGISGSLNVAGNITGTAITVNNQIHVESVFGSVTTTQYASIFAKGIGGNSGALMQVKGNDGTAGMGIRGATGVNSLIYSNGQIDFRVGSTIRDLDVPTGGTTFLSLSTVGVLTATGTSDSTSTSTGALVVTGGVGIGQSVSVGGRLQLFNSSNYTAFVSSATGNTVYSLPATSPATGSSVLQSTSEGVMSWVPMASGSSSGTVNSGTANFAAYYASTSTAVSENANLQFTGTGLSVGGNINSTSTKSGAFYVSGGLGVTGNAFIGGTTTIQATSNSFSATSGALVVSGGAGIAQSVSIGGRLQLFNSSNYTAFVSSATGNTVYTLPATSPATGSSVLQSTSGGLLSWVPMTSGSATPGGSLDGSVQYKSGSGFGGTRSFFFNTTTNGLRLGDFPGEEIPTSNSAALLIEQTISSFNGSVNGTLIGVNSLSSFTGDLINLQINAVTRFKVGYDGGMGVSSLSSSGNVVITSSTNSTSTTTGALVVTGGVGIGGTLNVGADLSISGLTTLTYTSEKLNTKTSATGTVTHDLSTGSVFYHSSISNNFTANFTNVPTTNDRALGVTLILAQGGTPYMSTALQIDGSAQTIKWVNNITPTGTANKVDIVGFSLIRTGSAWTVLGQYSTYG
jgi:hypothetical protein